jgi:hypothetical protein
MGLDGLLRLIREKLHRGFDDITSMQQSGALKEQGMEYMKNIGEFPEFGIVLKKDHVVSVKPVISSIRLCMYLCVNPSNLKHYPLQLTQPDWIRMYGSSIRKAIKDGKDQYQAHVKILFDRVWQRMIAMGIITQAPYDSGDAAESVVAMTDAILNVVHNPDRPPINTILFTDVSQDRPIHAPNHSLSPFAGETEEGDSGLHGSPGLHAETEQGEGRGGGVLDEEGDQVQYPILGNPGGVLRLQPMGR